MAFIALIHRRTSEKQKAVGVSPGICQVEGSRTFPHLPREPLRDHMFDLRQACVSTCHTGSRHGAASSPPGSMLGVEGPVRLNRSNI